MIFLVGQAGVVMQHVIMDHHNYMCNTTQAAMSTDPLLAQHRDDSTDVGSPFGQPVFCLGMMISLYGIVTTPMPIAVRGPRAIAVDNCAVKTGDNCLDYSRGFGGRNIAIYADIYVIFDYERQRICRRECSSCRHAITRQKLRQNRIPPVFLIYTRSWICQVNLCNYV